MGTEKDMYRSYLLRLWQVEHNGKKCWRASLEEVSTGQRRVFTTLDALFGYLTEKTAVLSTEQEEKLS